MSAANVPVAAVAEDVVCGEAAPTRNEPATTAAEISETSATVVSDTAFGAGGRTGFPSPPVAPTQLDASGIRFDFNDGCRVHAPVGPDIWRIRLVDLDTGNFLFQTTADFRGGSVRSAKKYFVRFRIEARRGEKLVFAHDYDAAGRDVLIAFPVGTLGDTLAWISYAVRFADRHQCRLSIAMAGRLISLFASAYPGIRFVDVEKVEPAEYYATYRVGLFFNDVERVHQPVDFRHVGLHRTAAHILGLDADETPPRLAVADGERPIAEKYVAIATQATSQCKYWNNPYGWREIVDFLKRAGYRVVCIDQKPVNGVGIVWNHAPAGAEDMTGKLSLEDCVRWIRHAEFFVGLSSGLAWLAWAARAKVVLISGFTLPNTEFATPWRVINYHTCVGCWNDPTLRFDHKDFLWCPRHAGTSRQFECTALITAQHVKKTIERLPGFPATAAKAALI